MNDLAESGTCTLPHDVGAEGLRVLVFTVLIALITGIAFGLAPALRATRMSSRSAVQTGSRGLTASRGGRRLGRALAIAQVALSLVLVVGAGLLVRTLRNLEALNPGFDPQQVLLFRLDPTRVGYQGERLAELYQQLLDRVKAVPGVRSASFSFLTPISGGGWDNFIFVEGYTPRPGEDMDTFINAVGPGFFDALRTPILLGRDFGAWDRRGSPPVAIVNETMARRFFAGGNAIGRKFGWGEGQRRAEYEVIGVVGDAKYLSLREQAPPTAYLSALQSKDWGGVTFEVRTAANPSGFTRQIRSRLRGLDSRLTASDVKTLAEQVGQSLYQEKLVSTLSTFFGALALLLACMASTALWLTGWRAGPTRLAFAWRWGPKARRSCGWCWVRRCCWRHSELSLAYPQPWQRRAWWSRCSTD